ncbi:unnamed protein product [Protopolystoma xenopodis]|uniref:Uncharacterized protein n=1 Tax=Protopolystoma xenopodis TaxID=117903 RepID=A0A448WCT1_9PLAT|nr:unnamed protein product [Protopolystoma xenopodis]
MWAGVYSSHTHTHTRKPQPEKKLFAETRYYTPTYPAYSDVVQCGVSLGVLWEGPMTTDCLDFDDLRGV